MKKLTAIILAAMLTLSLAGCANDSGAGNTSGSGNTSTSDSADNSGADASTPDGGDASTPDGGDATTPDDGDTEMTVDEALDQLNALLDACVADSTKLAEEAADLTEDDPRAEEIANELVDLLTQFGLDSAACIEVVEAADLTAEQQTRYDDYKERLNSISDEFGAE